MSLLQEVREADGSQVDKGQAWIISYWYIPGGADYEYAEACKCFIDDKQAAERIVARYENAPEMAFIISREEYEKVQKQIIATTQQRDRRESWWR